jgi:hypothetical protein
MSFSLTNFTADFLPLLLCLGGGYALARFTGMSTGPLQRLIRFGLLPLVLFDIILRRIEPVMFAEVAGIGAVLTLATAAVLVVAPRVLKPTVASAAATPNIAAFALPFLALSWRGVGLGTAAALFVGVAVTLLVVRPRQNPFSSLVRQPWAYAVIAALALRIASLDTQTITTALSPISSAAYPILLVFLGASLHPFNGFRDTTAWTTVFVRLLMGAIIGLLAILLIPMTRGVLEAVVIAALAPPATRAVAFVDDNAELGASPSSGNAMRIGTIVALVVVLFLDLLNW